MKTRNKYIRAIVIWTILIALVLPITSCNEEFLDENPQDQLSSSTFWQSEGDASLALIGVYSITAHWTGAFTLASGSDDIFDRTLSDMQQIAGTNISPSSGVTQSFWTQAWRKITAANNFLENIDQVEMDEALRTDYIAQVRFLRAHQYFWLTQFFGDVPLVTNVLTIQESNEVTRNSKSEVVSFVMSELTAAANDLPNTRPAADRGLAIKSAALAVKGRLEMSEQQWSAAASTFKEIIDLGTHSIYPDYEDLFLDGPGESSDEIIFSRIYSEDPTFGHDRQQRLTPAMYGGFHRFNISQDLVGSYLMTDGLSIEDSPLYDENNPFDNRDPRLAQTVFLPGVTNFRGVVFQTHPDSTLTDDTVPRAGSNGYNIKKWVDEDYGGDTFNYPGDIVYIRYAEVLLSYLESMLEAGNSIDQALLDLTINQLRSRPSVNMPIVTETNPTLLRDIVRLERRIELAGEGQRLWDLIRWDIAVEKLNRQFKGIRITMDPDNYAGPIVIDEDGFYVAFTNQYFEHNKLWPIPQADIDVNTNLTQNPGY